MLLTIQFPFADSRAFLNEKVNLLGRPTWPSAAPDTDFVRSFGSIRKRRLGGVEGWVGENVSCEARRALRFPKIGNYRDSQGLNVPLRLAFRRLYYDGLGVGKFEVGIASEDELSLSREQTHGLIDHCLNLPVMVPALSDKAISPHLAIKRVDTVLGRAGKPLARFYAGSTISHPLPAKREDWWVLSGTPLLFLVHQPLEVIRIPFLEFQIPTNLRQVLDLELQAVQDRIMQSGTIKFVFQCSDSAKDMLLREGLDFKDGTRHLKRSIERFLVYPLSNLMAEGQIGLGDLVHVDLDGIKHELVFSIWSEGALLKENPEEKRKQDAQATKQALKAETISGGVGLAIPPGPRLYSWDRYLDCDLSYCEVPYSGKSLRMWVMGLSPCIYSFRNARSLRICLLRLHAEHESMRLILQNVFTNKVDITPRTSESDTLQRYLNEATKRVSRLSSKVDRLSEGYLSELARESEDMVNPGEREALLMTLRNLDIRRNVFHKVQRYMNAQIKVQELYMDSKYRVTAGTIGAVGDEAQALNNTFNTWNQSGGDLKELAKELELLRAELGKQAKKPEEFESATAIARAVAAAEEGDGPTAFGHLKNAGKWALETAESIGVPVAIEAIKTAAGIG